MKKLFLAATFALALSLAACDLTGSSQVNTKVTPTAAPKANVFTSIKDALSKSLSLKCDYPDATGKNTVTAYIKNGAVRVSNVSVTAANNSDAIMKNNQMWIWTGKDKKGMLLSFNPQEIAQKTGESQPTQPITNNQGASLLGDLEKYKQYCSPSVVSDSMFTPPADIEFTDLSKLMQNPAGDALKNLPKGTPNIPNMPATETPPSGY